MTIPRLIALWSIPRSRSTAFYRMMLERGDTLAIHEPFSYLHEFGSVTVEGKRVTSEKALMRRLQELSVSRPVFFKDTTDEQYNLEEDEEFLHSVTHSFLLRHPDETARSYRHLNPDVTYNQLGFGNLDAIYQTVTRLTSQKPAIIDSADLVRDPAAIIRLWCRKTGLPFNAGALAWAPQSRSEWAPSDRWHHQVATSTGFHSDLGETSPTAPDPLARGHMETYWRLHAARLNA